MVAFMTIVLVLVAGACIIGITILIMDAIDK